MCMCGTDGKTCTEILHHETTRLRTQLAESQAARLAEEEKITEVKTEAWGVICQQRTRILALEQALRGLRTRSKDSHSDSPACFCDGIANDPIGISRRHTDECIAATELLRTLTSTEVKGDR
jgi:hypothetical protein